VEEKEKRREEKIYRRSSSVPWKLTCIGPLCRGWHDASDAAAEGYQQLPRGAARATHFLARAALANYFFNYGKTKTPLIS